MVGQERALRLMRPVKGCGKGAVQVTVAGAAKDAVHDRREQMALQVTLGLGEEERAETGCSHIQMEAGICWGGRAGWEERQVAGYQLCQHTAALGNGAAQPAVQHGLQHTGSRVRNKPRLLREYKSLARN